MWKSGFILSTLIVLIFARRTPLTGRVRSSKLVRSFESSLIRAIHHDKAEPNIFYSHLSIKIALIMFFLADEGPASNELRERLFLGSASKEIISDNCLSVADEKWATNANETFLNIEMALYFNDKYELNEELTDWIAESCYADVLSVDSSDSEGTANIMNDWLNETTNGYIANIMERLDFGEDTVAMLLSAVYFQAIWADSFSKVAGERNFTSIAGVVQKAQFITTRGNFKYIYLQKLNAEAVELKFKNSTLSILFIVPKKKDGIRALEKQLETDNVNKIRRELVMTEDLQVIIPKLKIQSDIDLIEAMERINITKIFEVGSGIEDLFQNNPSIQISEAKHAAYLRVELDEHGVKAASATRTRSSISSPPLQIIANHPFLFFIQSSKAILFGGRFGSANNST